MSEPIYVTSKGAVGTERYNAFKRFRTNLIILRAYHGFTGMELADVLKIAKKRVLDFETGRCNPNIYELDIISKYFEVTIDQLMHQRVKIAFEK